MRAGALCPPIAATAVAAAGALAGAGAEAGFGAAVGAGACAEDTPNVGVALGAQATLNPTINKPIPKSIFRVNIFSSFVRFAFFPIC
jgi:hypothetical protein